MLTKLTIDEISKGIARKEFSYAELIGAYKERFEQYKFLNSHVDEYWEEAAQRAVALDNSNNSSTLTGIPIAVKDMFLEKGKRATAASKVLNDFIAPYDAFVIEKLKVNGCIMPFRTNQDEFAMGSSGETSVYGPAINPWILSDRVPRVPGGSSSGSVAAVAASLCLAALGTDTGGSIRQPASFCGLVGFKPTYGRCSRRGVIAFGSSLDHPGVIARNVQDACYVIEAMAGHDKLEATSLRQDVPNISAAVATVKKRIGVSFEAFEHMPLEYQKHFNNLIESLRSEGAIIKNVDVPSFDLALKLYFIIAPAEAASNLARYDGIRYGARGDGKTFEEILGNTRNLFGMEVKRRILIGNFVLFSDEYDKFFGKAVKLRAQIVRQLDAMFENHDVLLLPTSPGVAFPLGSQRSALEMYREDLYTILANIYGGPAINVPLCKILDGRDGREIAKATSQDGLAALKSCDGLPMGLQIMARREDEISMIEVAKKIEELVGWKGLE